MIEEQIRGARVTLDQAGQYRVASPVPVKAELPKGSKVTFAVPGKAR